VFYRDQDHVYRLSELAAWDWLDHGFGTRLSVSWPPGPVATVKQVHSDIVLAADGASGALGRADALVSATAGPYLAIRTADCVPILIADERRRAVGAIHAGWRGSVARIAGKTVEMMGARFGSRPEDIVAAIGPAICGKCYTVGPEVANLFKKWFPERDDLDGEAALDLAETNRRQLVAAGIPPERVYSGAPCTRCHPEEFHSHRRTPGQAGRMLSAVAIRTT
jgi:YfiH family protein